MKITKQCVWLYDRYRETYVDSAFDLREANFIFQVLIQRNVTYKTFQKWRKKLLEAGLIQPTGTYILKNGKERWLYKAVEEADAYEDYDLARRVVHANKQS